MKEKLFALSLLAVSGLIADGHYRDDRYYDNSCDPCTTCEPCCVPKPKKCIDCECYSPAFYDLQCAWGAFVDAEFLYWYARETDLPYAFEVKGTNLGNPGNDLIVSGSRVRTLDVKWDPGFRVGLGWNSECDGWDLYLNWTWYRNKKSNRTSVDPHYSSGTTTQFNFDIPSNDQFALVDPWINTAFGEEASTTPVASVPDTGTDSLITFNSIRAKWRLQYNNIDLELGRQYWLSRCMTMRPYVGLRGAWTKTRFSVRSNRDFTSTTPLVYNASRSFRDRFTDRQWGVGFLAGFQPTFLLGCNISIYGNFDAALIWGKYKDHKKERYSETSTVGGVNFNTYVYGPNRVHAEFFTMVPIVDLAIGFRWEDTWCGDRYRTLLDLGWEHHVWFNFNHRYLYNGSYNVNLNTAATSNAEVFSGFDVVNTSLYFGGFVLRLKFDF